MRPISKRKCPFHWQMEQDCDNCFDLSGLLLLLTVFSSLFVHTALCFYLQLEKSTLVVVLVLAVVAAAATAAAVVVEVVAVVVVVTAAAAVIVVIVILLLLLSLLFFFVQIHCTNDELSAADGVWGDEQTRTDLNSWQMIFVIDYSI